MKLGITRKFVPLILILLGISYGLWPIDIIPDVPIIGWIDDLGVMGALLFWAIKISLKKSSKVPRIPKE